MNVFQVMEAFKKAESVSHLSPLAVKLYFFLTIKANDHFWKGPLKLTWRDLRRELGMSNNALSKAINELKERNLIIYSSDRTGAFFWFPEPALDNQDHPIAQSVVSADEAETAHLRVAECSPVENSCSPTESTGALHPRTLLLSYREHGALPQRARCSPTESTWGHIYKENIKENIKEKIEEKIKEKQEILNSTNNNAQSLYKATVQSHSTFISFKEQYADIYTLLDEQMQSIIATWEAVTGTPWQFKWLKALKEALDTCYPFQIVRGIVNFAKSSPEKLKQAGFPYILPAIRNGAFGKKNQNKSASRRDSDGGYQENSWFGTFETRETDFVREAFERAYRATKEEARRLAKLYGSSPKDEHDTDGLPEDF